MSDDGRYQLEHALVDALQIAIEEVAGPITTAKVMRILNALVIITGSLVGADHSLDIDKVAARIAERIVTNARQARADGRGWLS